MENINYDFELLFSKAVVIGQFLPGRRVPKCKLSWQGAGGKHSCHRRHQHPFLWLWKAWLTHAPCATWTERSAGAFQYHRKFSVLITQSASEILKVCHSFWLLTIPLAALSLSKQCLDPNMGEILQSTGEFTVRLLPVVLLVRNWNEVEQLSCVSQLSVFAGYQ